MLQWIKTKFSKQSMPRPPRTAQQSGDDPLGKPIPVFGLDSQLTFYQVVRAFNHERLQIRQKIDSCVSGLSPDVLDGCQVGIWLDAVAAVGYEDFLAEMHTWHEQWHLATAEVIRQANAGRLQDARMSLRQGACAYAARRFTKTLESFWIHFQRTSSM